MRVNRAPESNRALAQPPNGYFAKVLQVYGFQMDCNFEGTFFMARDSICLKQWTD